MTQQGKILDLQDFFQTLLKYDVVFVGETHDSPLSHEAELAILTGLVEQDPSLVLALEMFERDVQEVLDAYLEGMISEERFLEAARPWPNYPSDYRPLVEMAKAKGIPVLAANVPRRAAAAVAMTNELSSEVLETDGVYLPASLHFDSKEYYERFMATVVDMPHRGPMRRLNPEALYKAQILKDAVMAASIEPFLDQHVLFICGSFHSDYRLGIPYQLRKNHPNTTIAVITMASSVEDLPMKERSRVADYFWLDE